MSESVFDCEELESLLTEYLDGDIDAAQRRAVETHAAGCARCAALLSEVSAIVRDAGDLPVLAPSHDLWPGIEARIQPDVLPLPAVRAEKAVRAARTAPRWMTARLAAAAAALVVSTAEITYVATTHADSARTVAAAGPATSTNGAPANGAPASGAPDGAAHPAGTAGGAVRGTTPSRVRNASTLSSEQLYNQEIAHLQTIVRERGSLLDTATIAVIQRNLGIIDSAIAQSRAALAADPNSRFLNDQLNSVLGQKVELLRTAALLPART